MGKWTLDIRRQYGLGINVAVLLLVCCCIVYQLHKRSVYSCSYDGRIEFNWRTRLLTNNEFREMNSGFRVRRHAYIRQKRFVRVKLALEKENGRFRGLKHKKIKPVVKLKQASPFRPRVIIKKHAMFRQKTFVQVRGKKQMDKVKERINYYENRNNHWLL